MGQQTIDTKINEYGLANTETGLSKHDKQLFVPVAEKKTALRDLQKDNRIMVPKSVDSEPSIEAVKVSGTKRASPECPASYPNPHSPNGHLVYVRRKAEAESSKGSTAENICISADYRQLRIINHQNNKIQQDSHIKDSKICVPEAAPIATSAECFSSRKPSGPLPVGKVSNTLPSADSNCFQYSSSTLSSDYPQRKNAQHWDERYGKLQNLLKILDQSNQEGYIQMLRSFSSVELSRHAVELEKRSIMLSLEEGKELQRVRLLDILGKYSNNSGVPSTRQGQSEK